MEKVSKEIFNVKQENIEKLKQLFPSAIKDGLLDVKALKEELGTFEEVGQEKYEMNWAGKQKAKQFAQQAPLGKTLKYVKGDGINEDTTENIYIEGDNLEVLKLLRKNYYGSIKMIYIDPPYNTGNDFVYKDNFGITQQQLETAQGQRTEEGEKLQKNTKEGNAKYHTNWLNMMYPRLKLAKDLLTDDGVIFISIDDNEQANLKKICDEIFGEENFIADFIVVSAPAGTQSAINVSVQQSYCLSYAKHYENIKFILKRTQEELKDRYSEIDSKGRFYCERLWKRGVGGKKEDVPSLHFPVFYNPKTGKILIDSEYNNESDFVKIIPYHTAGVLGRWTWSRTSMISKRDNLIVKKVAGEWKLHKKVYESEETGKLPFSIIGADIGRTEIGGLEVKNLFDNKKLFDYPKPVNFVKHLCSFFQDKNFLILDFFSGSATTAHAVMQLNAEDGGNRKFIMVQLPELCDEKSEAYKAGYKNICEIGKERIRRAGKKIQQENPDKQTDIGFKVFKIDDTTLNWEKSELEGKDLYSNYNENNTEKDKLDFTPGFTDLDVVYEIMLRQEGLSLTSKIEQLTDIGSRTYLVANSYLICLEENITEEIIKKLSELEPLPIKFVFRDSAFDDDIALKDESFRRLSALIDKNKGATKQVYTIEFI